MAHSKSIIKLAAAWLLAAIPAYFLVGYIAQPEPQFLQVILLTLVFVAVAGLAAHAVLPKVSALKAKESWLRHWPLLAAALLLGRFVYRVIGLSLSMPKLLQADSFLLPGEQTAGYAAGALLGLAALWLATQSQHRWRPGVERFAELCRQNWRGLLLGAIFFTVYLVLANVFNRLDFNNNNVFFAADSHQWRLRMSDPAGANMEMRAVHPLGFFLVRPPVWLLATLLGAAPFQANMLLLALVGGLEIGLAWRLLWRLTGSGDHAFLFAAVLGLSSAALMFNSLTESYIFSGFLLVLFFVLLQAKAHWGWLVAAAAGIFGLAVTNLAQAALGLWAGLNFKRAVVLTLAAAVIGAGLNVAQSLLYPDAELVFSPSDIGYENQHIQEFDTAQDLQARASILAKDLFVFNIVAPEPYQVEQNKDGREAFPKFYMMLGPKAADLVGSGRYAAWLWIGLLAAGLAGFGTLLAGERLSAVNRYGLAFAGCLAFNYALHLTVGFEPFLYVADWTFALVFLVALGLRKWGDSLWVQLPTLALVGLLSLSNLSFLAFLMRGLSAYLPV